MIKKRTRPQGRVRVPSPEPEEDGTPKDEEDASLAWVQQLMFQVNSDVIP
jgi:hypothetical protein